MPDLRPLHVFTVMELLQPDAYSDDLADCEERDHPWLTPDKPPPIDRPLLRLWDKNSGSQPGETWGGFMLARAQQQPLHDAKSRRESLKIHAKNSKWVPTPYISFSSSPKAIQDLAAYRKRKERGRQWLTAINPGVRRARGLPVLDIGAEMKHYGIPNPYRHRNNYYKNHYVCLWEVAPREIVHTWEWDELKIESNWYKDIVLPKFQQHNDIFTARQQSEFAALFSRPHDRLLGYESDSSSEDRVCLFDEEIQDDMDWTEVETELTTSPESSWEPGGGADGHTQVEALAFQNLFIS